MEQWRKFEGLVRQVKESYLARHDPEYFRDMLLPVVRSLRQRLRVLSENYDAAVHYKLERDLEDMGRTVALFHRSESKHLQQNADSSAEPDGTGNDPHARSHLFFLTKKRLESQLMAIVANGGKHLLADGTSSDTVPHV